MRGEASRPPILSLHPDSNMLETQQRNNEHSKVPNAKGTVPRALTHWPRTGQVALQKPSVWQSPAHWAWSGPLSHQHSPPETADLGGEMHQARLAGGGGGGRL